MFENFNIDKVFQYLLIILAFLMPLTVFGGNLIIVIICLLWLFSGNYKSKFDQIINNKLIEKGNTNLVLGNPLNSAIWLVNKLALKGEPMLKGQFITTGTCTKAVKLKKRSIIKADFGSLGSIDFKYI